MLCLDKITFQQMAPIVSVSASLTTINTMARFAKKTPSANENNIINNKENQDFAQTNQIQDKIEE